MAGFIRDGSKLLVMIAYPITRETPCENQTASRCECPDEMNLTDEFTALVNAMQDANIEFAVCGGMAMALHGYPRFTNDIDLLIRPGDLDAAVKAARSCGFDDEVESIKLGQRTGRLVDIRRINKFKAESFMTLDFVLVTMVLEDVWRGRSQFKWENRSLLVVTASGLAKMKMLAGRPQDLLDIQTLGFALDDPAIQS